MTGRSIYEPDSHERCLLIMIRLDEARRAVYVSLLKQFYFPPPP